MLTISRSCGLPRTQITLRNLLTHTAGFVYDTWNEEMARYAKITDLPGLPDRQTQIPHRPAELRPRRTLGIRHQHRERRRRMVEVASGLDLETYMQRPYLRAAEHARHKLRDQRAEGKTAGRH